VKIELAEPQTEEELAEYYRLRYERLRKDLGLPEGSERDHPAEAGSSHLIAKIGSRVVGAACWAIGMRKNESSGKRELYVRYRQLAVDPELDERGIGIVLTRRVEKQARAIGAEEVVANVRLERVPYFESLGYVVAGEGETLFGTLEHKAMTKTL
jgi:predicted N-acetyltransferase YhbS